MLTQLEGTVNYWWDLEPDNPQPNTAQRKTLRDIAIGDALEQIKKGFIEGQLEAKYTHKEESFDITGWWSHSPTRRYRQ